MKPDFESENILIEPLTTENWDKFVTLFGPRGACGSCWCMYYRLSKQAFHEGKSNDGNKNAMNEIIRSGRPAGLLGTLEGEAIAWCAFAPREDFARLERSRVHKRIDDEHVWSIPCFFIGREYRKSGLSLAFLKKVIEYAVENKIGILEAYPVIPTVDKLPDSFIWPGLFSTFTKAGFRVVDRKSANRPMVRFQTSPE